MKASRWLAVASAIVVLLALVGCGGSDDSATAGSSPGPTWTEFLKKAIPICERGTNKIDVLFAKVSKHVPKDDKNEHFLNEAAARIVIPIRREELRKIQALGPPAGHGQTVEDSFPRCRKASNVGNAAILLCGVQTEVNSPSRRRT